MLSIVNQLKSKDISLDDAINSGKLPDHILHTFACDCAERALIRERKKEREPDPRSWEAIRVKRLWIEGKSSNEELDVAWAAAWSAARDAARYAAWAAAWAAAWSAARDAAWSAAWDAAWDAAWAAALDAAGYAALDAARKKERSWQKEHLLAMIEQYQTTRSSLLSTLLQRANNLTITIPQWQKESEDVLYS